MESLADVEVDRRGRRRRRSRTHRGDQAQRRPRHLDGHGPREVAARACATGCRFLDIIARQVLHLRQEYDAPLPLIFMNSFRTSADTMAALARYDDLAGRRAAAGVPAEQGAQAPRRRPDARSAGPRTPTSSGARPATATSTPRCAAPACSSGCIDAGYERVFVSNSDNLGAVPDAAGRRLVRRRPGRRSRSRPSAVRRPTARAATSRAASPTAGSCCARPRRRSPEDQEALADLDRHRFCSTNNLWFDLRAMTRRARRAATASSACR